ncbi:MAG: glutathione S-transferase [Pseudomonadales bacterium]|nr:glutathione S-transferase [Pseudomonadales bacterium]
MIVLHHLNNSRSQRILWMLEELNVPYEIKRYARDAKTMLAPQSLRDVHPLGKSPVITDGDITVAESGAIIEYLALTYGDGAMLAGEDAAAQRNYRYWMHYAEGSLMPPFLMRLIFEVIKSSPMPFFIRPIAKGISNKVTKAFIGPNIKNNLDFIESELDGLEWLVAGKPTGADVQMSFPLEASAARGGVGEQYPNIRAYVARIHARPAYQRGLKAGGEYDYA